MIGIDDLLRSGFFGIFLTTIAVMGWLWNIIIVAAMIQNRIPFSNKVMVFGAVPFGLSLYFTGIGLGLATRWYRDFYRPDKDELMNLDEWLDRIQRCI